MAANYWASTQRRHWQFTKEKLAESRSAQEDIERGLIQQYPLPERRLLSIFFKERMAPAHAPWDVDPVDIIRDYQARSTSTATTAGTSDCADLRPTFLY